MEVENNWESWFDSLITVPEAFLPRSGNSPTQVWFGVDCSVCPLAFFLVSLSHSDTQGQTIIFFKWLLEAHHPAPALFLCTSHPQGKKSLKSQSIRGSIHMPFACFLMFRGTRNTCNKYDVGAPYSFPLRLMDCGAPAPPANRWGPQVATCPLLPGHFLFPDFHRGSQTAGCILKGRATLPLITMATAEHQPSVVVFSRRYLSLGLWIAFFQWLVICDLWLYVEKGLSLPGSLDQ